MRPLSEASFPAEQASPGIIQVVPAIPFQPLGLGIRQVQNTVTLGADHFRSRPVKQDVAGGADPYWNAQALQADTAALLLIVNRPRQWNNGKNQEQPQGQAVRHR